MGEGGSRKAEPEPHSLAFAVMLISPATFIFHLRLSSKSKKWVGISIFENPYPQGDFFDLIRFPQIGVKEKTDGKSFPSAL